MEGRRVWGQWRGEWEGTVVMANNNRINSKTEIDRHVHCPQRVSHGTIWKRDTVQVELERHQEYRVSGYPVQSHQRWMAG